MYINSNDLANAIGDIFFKCTGNIKLNSFLNSSVALLSFSKNILTTSLNYLAFMFGKYL